MDSVGGLSFLEWTSQVIRYLLSSHPHLVLVDEKRTPTCSISVLMAPLTIDSRQIGIRKYLVGAVDTAGEELTATGITEFDDLASAEFGVISHVLFANGVPDEATRQRLGDLQIRYVQILGDEFVAPTETRLLANLAHLLLGERMVVEAAERTRADSRDEIEDESQEIIEQLLVLGLRLYLEQEDALRPPSRNRRQVAATTGGERTSLALGIATKETDRNGKQFRFCYPWTQKLVEGFQYASAMLDRLERLRVPTAGQSTREILIELSRELQAYYATWLVGSHDTLIAAHILEHVEALRSAPHALLLSRSLGGLQVMDQIERVSLITALGAKACAKDIVSLIKDAAPVLQETCLNALRQLGASPSIAMLEELAGSRREAVSSAAIRLLAEMGGEDAAAALIGLISAGTVPLTEQTVKAVSLTRSREAFIFLVNLCATHDGNVAPLGLEVCLDHFGPLVDAGQTSFKGDESWLLRVCRKLYESQSHPEIGRRVALKTVSLFRLDAGKELILKGLAEDSLITRISAMRAARAFPDDVLASAVVESVSAPLTEGHPDFVWTQQMLTVMQGHEGPGGQLGSVADLDLAACATATLQTMGEEFFQRFGAFLPGSSASDSNATDEHLETSRMCDAFCESIYATPDGGFVWLSTLGDGKVEANQDPTVMATIIHGRLGTTPHAGVASAMLGGGMTMTTGSRTEVREDVVRALLRGEEPRLPTIAGMGETAFGKRTEHTTTTATLPRKG